MKQIGLTQAATLLQGMDNVGVLTHRNPDGDCLGSGYGLCLILRAMGKRAGVLCSDKMGDKFSTWFAELDDAFEPEVYVSVDVATPELLGDYRHLAEEGRVVLSIDHHPTNSGYAAETWVEPSSSATAELVYLLAESLDVPVDKTLATALYIGILTDTGCFQFSNTTSRTHHIAAELMKKGAPAEELNRTFFGIKSRGRMQVEAAALSTMRYFARDRVAIMMVTEEMKISSGVSDDELDGLAALPRQVEGVEIGVTLREKEPGAWRVSVRTNTTADASAVCAVFGGGGHVRAGGCTVTGDADTAMAKLAEACQRELEKNA